MSNTDNFCHPIPEKVVSYFLMFKKYIHYYSPIVACAFTEVATNFDETAQLASK